MILIAVLYINFFYLRKSLLILISIVIAHVSRSITHLWGNFITTEKTLESWNSEFRKYKDYMFAINSFDRKSSWHVSRPFRLGSIGFWVSPKTCTQSFMVLRMLFYTFWYVMVVRNLTNTKKIFFVLENVIFSSQKCLTQFDLYSKIYRIKCLSTSKFERYIYKFWK